MAIPQLNEFGLLPQGIWECTLAEVEKRFGRFSRTDTRPRLFAALREYCDELAWTTLVSAIVIDGSFVTDKEAPGDIDLVIILDVVNWEEELNPRVYNVLSRKRVARRFPFDIVLASEDSPEYLVRVQFFQQVRNSNTLKKGLLWVSL